MKRISVVVPVYEEADNITVCLARLSQALRDEEHELLICYDRDEDSTLAAIDRIPIRPKTLVLVKNRRGRGVANAIRSGFQAATGDVVVTTMADLSDPPEIIPVMAAKIRAGADVVSGSRYMPGGSQTGAPWLKATLSRLAGLTLYWLAGMGTRDATTNFRAYSRSFLEAVTIETEHGFDLALELTVKAHCAGRMIDEVPSSWIERTAGQSRFRLWLWLPRYLRWFLQGLCAQAMTSARHPGTGSGARRDRDGGGSGPHDARTPRPPPSRE